MKRKVMLILTLGTMLAALAGCGGGADSAGFDMEAPAASAPAMEEYYYESSKGGDIGMADTATGSGSSNPVYQDPNAKLIREASLSIQTTEFETAVSQLDDLVVEMGGYFQNASLRGGSYRNANANRAGEYTVRVPADNYDAFMGRTGELGYVTSRSETTENIGEQYYDTEARLKTQKTKQERLLSLLEKAETMEDIITLESALSDVEYEIERLSSTLNRYDSLVGFSTIWITLNEVHKVSEETGVADTLGERMAKGLSSSVEGMIDGTQDLLVWMSYHVFGLLVLAAIALGGGVTVNKIRRRRATAPNEPQENKK